MNVPNERWWWWRDIEAAEKSNPEFARIWQDDVIRCGAVPEIVWLYELQARMSKEGYPWGKPFHALCFDEYLRGLRQSFEWFGWRRFAIALLKSDANNTPIFSCPPDYWTETISRAVNLGVPDQTILYEFAGII